MPHASPKFRAKSKLRRSQVGDRRWGDPKSRFALWLVICQAPERGVASQLIIMRK